MPLRAPLRVVVAVVLFAFAVLATAAAPAAAQPAERIAGTVERLRGEAARINTDGTVALAPGVPVLVGDAVTTGPGARLIIRFRDNSTLTMGEQGRIIIDAMVYAHPSVSTDPPAQTLDILRGVFRYVSGAISAAAPARVAIRTPVASIGIRGTDFAGGELYVGMPPGRPHYGFQIQEGAIEVIAPGGTAILDAPGEGTFLPMTLRNPPTPVRVWSPAAAAELAAALAF